MTSRSRDSSGYSAWRRIADELRTEIVRDVLPAGTKMPSESELAERFHVHRHTVRQAVAALSDEKLVESRRGSGTFVTHHAVVVHRIGVRTRLTDSLGDQRTAVTGRLLEWHIEETPPPDVSKALQLDAKPALRMETLRYLDRVPIARGTTWLPASLAPAIPEHYAADGSFTAALRTAGVDDYVRTETTIGARTATSVESSELTLPAGATLLIVHALNNRLDGTPVMLNITAFAAGRVELSVEHPDPVQ